MRTLAPPSPTSPTTESDQRLGSGRSARAHGRDASSTAGQRRGISADAVSGIRPRKSTDDQLAQNNPHTTGEKTVSVDTQDRHEKHDMSSHLGRRRPRLQSPWSCSRLTIVVTTLALALAFTIMQSFLSRQRDPDGCQMSWMRPAFAHFPDFDTEHTRFASKYSLYLYREREVDEDTRVKGIPVLFIPGNAGSYKQVRPLAAEAAVYFQQLQHFDSENSPLGEGKLQLDFFTVDFNEDFTAFHGQTLLDQAEYLNEAISYILSLYHNPHRSLRDPDLPDPTSVIIVGHSMGGIVARTMLTLPNYQSNSINTIITLSAPHARPPVSFDADIVNTYSRVNDYWRDAYSQQWANNNPLRHVTLVSIAGGGLDTVVPSDYSTLSSLVPPTHGFTVFTSTVPRVWTGMDHLAITWCDQLRKSIIKALYDVVDAGRPNQTRPRPERMRAFKKWLLTGMEDVAEKTLSQKDPGTLLTLEDNSNAMLAQGERLALARLGHSTKPKAYLLPIPPQESPHGRRFTLLTDQKLDQRSQTNMDVMFCSVFPLHAGQSSAIFSMNMDLSGDTSGSTRLACKNAASDTILLPASTRESRFPYEHAEPFTYLQYDLEQLADHQFVAVVDKATTPAPGWVVAEFSSKTDSDFYVNQSLGSMLWSGVDITFPAERPMMTEIRIPPLSSSMLAYRLSIGKQSCGDETELFTPLLRQHISNPYESKFFVNLKETDINMHGVAPFLPPALRGQASPPDGMTLQFWSDPTCNSSMHVSLKLDAFGSLGKLWMRYRTAAAAFPLLVIALALRKQFQLYDATGVFITFQESMEQSLRRALPVFTLGLTFLALYFSNESQAATARQLQQQNSWWTGNATAKAPAADIAPVDFSINDFLLGSQDPFFWFLIPLFVTISVGVCICVNYVTLLLTQVCSWLYRRAIGMLPSSAERNPILDTFTTTSLKKRIITASILLFLVSTVIPYQFVFIVLCIVQLFTCIRALSVARETYAAEHINFSNYTHSILLLMLWILPINIPVLVVWVRNLAVHWLTPFSSHHNILSIMPFVLLVEILNTGRMLPRISGWFRLATNVGFFALAIYAAVYGITYAYLLHYIVNIICSWLAIAHFWRGDWFGSGAQGSNAAAPPSNAVASDADGAAENAQSVKKRP